MNTEVGYEGQERAIINAALAPQDSVFEKCDFAGDVEVRMEDVARPGRSC